LHIINNDENKPDIPGEINLFNDILSACNSECYVICKKKYYIIENDLPMIQ